MKEIVPECTKKFDLKTSDCAILLMGDFNINYKSSSYDQIFEIFPGVCDLHHNFCQEKKIKVTNTYGGNSYALYEKQTIDFIFSFLHFNNFNLAQIQLLDFKVVGKDLEKPLSDHYGLSIKFNIE